MSYISRTLFASCLTCIAMAATSIALAEEEQTKQQTKDQQPSKATEQKDAASPEQQTSDQLDQQNAQQDEKTRQINDNRTDISRDAERSASDQKSSRRDQSSRDQNPQLIQPGQTSSQPSSRNRQWRSGVSRDAGTDQQVGGSAGRDNDRRSSRDQQSINQQGASLGVSIVTSGDGRGVIVTRVHPDTPAQQMDIREGDRIISVNGDSAQSADEFISTIRGMNPGDEIELEIARDGGEQNIRGQLERFNENRARSSELSGNDEFRRYEGVINRNRPGFEQFSRNGSLERSGEWVGPEQRPRDRDLRSSDRANRQTSYEERSGESSRSSSGDVDRRLTRIEQQLDRLTQDLEELHNIIGPGRLREDSATGVNDTSRNRSNKPQTRQNEPQPNGAALKRDDRWNTCENRFEQADLAGARERAAAEAARRRAEATGAQLQQQQQDSLNRGAQPSPGGPQNTSPSTGTPLPSSSPSPTGQPSSAGPSGSSGSSR